MTNDVFVYIIYIPVSLVSYCFFFFLRTTKRIHNPVQIGKRNFYTITKCNLLNRFLLMDEIKYIIRMIIRNERKQIYNIVKPFDVIKQKRLPNLIF